MIFTKIFLKRKGDRKTVEKKREGKKKKKGSKEKNKGGRRKEHAMSFYKWLGLHGERLYPSVFTPRLHCEALHHF